MFEGVLNMPKEAANFLHTLLLTDRQVASVSKASVKLIKTTQKCLIFWNLLGVLINKVFAIFEFIR